MRPSNFSHAGRRCLLHGGCGGSIHTEATRLVCQACATVITDPREIVNPTVEHADERRVYPTGSGAWWG